MPQTKTQRFEMRTDVEWLRAMDLLAKATGLSRSAAVRLAAEQGSSAVLAAIVGKKVGKAT